MPKVKTYRWLVRYTDKGKARAASHQRGLYPGRRFYRCAYAIVGTARHHKTGRRLGRVVKGWADRKDRAQRMANNYRSPTLTNVKIIKAKKVLARP